VRRPRHGTFREVGALIAAAREGSLLLLDYDAPFGIQVHVVLVAVLAGRGVVVLGQYLDGNDLAARHAVERDDCRQVLLERLLVLLLTS